MIEAGKVVRLKDDKAVISFARRACCDRCAVCTVNKDGASVEIEVENTLNLNVGDCVKVQVFKRKIRAASVLVYVLPLLLIALGAGLGSLASAAASAILGVLGLVVGLAFAVPLDVCVLRKRDGYKPRMIEVCNQEDCNTAV